MRIIALVLVALVTVPLMAQDGYIIHGRRPAAAAGDPLTDWTASFVMVVLLEESATPSSSESAADCTDCDWSWSGDGVSQYTTSYMEGSSAVQVLDAGGGVDRIQCDSRTAVGNKCNVLEITGDISFGGWIRNDDMDGDQVEYLNAHDPWTGGYGLTNDTNSTVNSLRCWIENSSGTATVATNTSSQSDATWYHAVCTYDDDGDGGGDDGILVYRDGEDDTSGTPTRDNLGADTEAEYTMVDGAAASYTAQIDEFFIIDQELTASEICRICSCGIAGDNCSCDGTSYVDDGRNSTGTPNCGSCTLPACNAAAP